MEFLQNQDILSSSGDIFLYGNSRGLSSKIGARFGSRIGSGVTSSSSDLKISGMF